MKGLAVLGVLAAIGLWYAVREARFGPRLPDLASNKAVSTCLELGGHTTALEQGRTYITGTIRNRCDRKFGNVTIVFKLDPKRGPMENLQGVAYAYARDMTAGETKQFKSALPISEDSTYRFDSISAY